MKIKNFFNNLFSYTPPNHYEFSIIDSTSTKNSSSFDTISEENDTKIYPSLSVNLEYMKTKYNVLINSDIILRE